MKRLFGIVSSGVLLLVLHVFSADQSASNASLFPFVLPWDDAPSLVEGIPAGITLPLSASRVHVWALDERGQRRTELSVNSAGNNAVFNIGPSFKTLWYEVEVRVGK
jgi:hypothetical protein